MTSSGEPPIGQHLSGSGFSTKLVVDFIGSTVQIVDGGTLTFGRDADLSVDDNPYLHRRLGLFSCDGGVWWLHNTGSRIPIEVRDTQSLTRFTLAPGSSAALTAPLSVVQFSADSLSYEIGVSIVDPRVSGGSSSSPIYDEPDDGALTIGLATLPLTDDQLRVLVVLCESALLDAASDPQIPTNRVAALRLGWTVKAYGRKLDNICDRFSRIGVKGLRGDASTVAKDRRLALAHYALGAGLVSVEHLSLIDAAAA